MGLTPMMKQYLDIKKENQGAFLFFRMGDFYEMFFEDAQKGAEILDITLTARGSKDGNKVPMCGVPFHSAQSYINRLTQNGHRVAICEQVEDPKQTKGIVKRQVTRIISPGTNLDDDSDLSSQHQYILSLCESDKLFDLSFIDISTGNFHCMSDLTETDVLNQISLINPREIITKEKLKESKLFESILKLFPSLLVEIYEDWVFDLDYAQNLIFETFNLQSVQSLGFDQADKVQIPIGVLLYYLRQNLYENLKHLHYPKMIQTDSKLLFDRHTLQNLEILPASNQKNRPQCLYDILNRTKTPLGSRNLLNWLKAPTTDLVTIQARHEIVRSLNENLSLSSDLDGYLSKIKDIEKIVGRLANLISNPRDLEALQISLQQLPKIKKSLETSEAEPLHALSREITLFDELQTELEKAIVETPPTLVKNGGFIQKGYSIELDDLKKISTGGREWILSFQREEIERTGIRSLKVKYNKVFGYYIEVTKANSNMVPDDYERKQTLVNAERFTVPKLKEYEEKILHADDKAHALEIKIFESLRKLVLDQINKLQKTAHVIAKIDTLLSFSKVANENNYVQPEVSKGYDLAIEQGRHPIVETCLNQNEFIPNDLEFHQSNSNLHIITGPNMAGKSTYLRQNALIVIMAQIGSFVPAKSAKLPIIDKVFTRIGASDNLTLGESTFMVEMIETANILNNATENSLLIMDEVGRGTSTFDGVSIAWALCEFLAKKEITPKTLFATHYHELAELESLYPSIQNYNASVKDTPNGILFLRKMIKGSADKSYGIHVAELAGIPKEVITRAKQVLTDIEIEHAHIKNIPNQKKEKSFETDSLPLFNVASEPTQEEMICREIDDLDLDQMTPLEALQYLTQIKNKIKTKVTN